MHKCIQTRRRKRPSTLLGYKTAAMRVHFSEVQAPYDHRNSLIRYSTKYDVLSRRTRRRRYRSAEENEGISLPDDAEEMPKLETMHARTTLFVYFPCTIAAVALF